MQIQVNKKWQEFPWVIKGKTSMQYAFVLTFLQLSLAWSFWAAKSDFCSIMQKFLHDEKIFLQPKNFCHLCQNSFFDTTFDIQSFWKVHEIGFKIFSWWEKISACCKNLHPWFCSLGKPHYCMTLYLKGSQKYNRSKLKVLLLLSEFGSFNFDLSYLWSPFRYRAIQ